MLNVEYVPNAGGGRILIFSRVEKKISDVSLHQVTSKCGNIFHIAYFRHCYDSDKTMLLVPVEDKHLKRGKKQI